MTQGDELFNIRRSASRAMILFLWAHVPLVGGTAAIMGADWFWLGMAAAACAGLSTIGWAVAPVAKSTRMTMGVALICMASLLIAAGSGSPWQVDLHMYVFIQMAILAVFCDRDVILAGALTAAVHHLALNELAPALILPGGRQMWRIVLHAACVVMEAGALIWLTQRIVAAFAASARHLDASIAASERSCALEAAADMERGREAAEGQRIRRETEEAVAADAARLVVGSIGSGLEHLAAGDLTYRLGAALPARYEKLRADLNTAAGGLDRLLQGVVVKTASLRSGTMEVAQASRDMGRRTEQQASGLEQTAAALGQITTTVKLTATGSQQAQRVVAAAKRDAEHISTIVDGAVVAMGRIDDSSRQIGQIIGVIDGMAFQTNLLALNAGVEAARAGDAGRGFAVVASEVRALAQRSTDASKEIKALVVASDGQVKAGVALVGEAGAALSRIIQQVSEINTLVADIAGSAGQQATGLEQINTAISQMDQATQENAATAEKSASALQDIAQETEELAGLIARFQVSEAECSADLQLAPARRRLYAAR